MSLPDMKPTSLLLYGNQRLIGLYCTVAQAQGLEEGALVLLGHTHYLEHAPPEHRREDAISGAVGKSARVPA